MKNLNEMTAKELKEMAKEMKISNWWNLKKSVLIEKIEEAQNMTEEEKQAIADQKAREDAAIKEYTKNWSKYTKRYNVLEFIEKWRSGEIVLESETSEVEELEEVMEEEIPSNTLVETPAPEKITAYVEEEKPAYDCLKDEVRDNIENAYNWTVGGYENSVTDGEMTQEEFDEWIKNKAFIAVYQEAISTRYTGESCGGEPPKGMKSADKKACMDLIMELFKADGYEVEMPEIKAGHAPTPKRGQLIEYDGEAMNICAWGEKLGISPNTLYGRIYKMNWSVEKAFTTPSKKRK